MRPVRETTIGSAIQSLPVPNNVNPKRYRLRLSAMCGFVGLLAFGWIKGCDPLWRPFNQARFDVVAWRRHSDVDKDRVRMGMAGDIVSNVIKPGMTRQQVEQILGKGDMVPPGHMIYFSLIGDEVNGLTYSIGHPPTPKKVRSAIVITFNEAGVVRRAVIDVYGI